MMDFSHITNDIYTQIALIVLLLSFVELAVYYGMYYFRIGRKVGKVSQKTANSAELGLPPVSVVLTTHNEANYLRENLIYILEQEYPDFEVVVVNYLSQDDTEFVLRVCRENYNRLKVINFREDVNMYKSNKYPLSIGIREAKNDLLVLTDADCVPNSPLWLYHTVKSYQAGKTDIALGYCQMKAEAGLLGLLERYDNIAYSTAYLVQALSGHPYTGCGRNLSYRRSFFFNTGAFSSQLKEQYGADDIFINQNANKNNTVINVHRDAFVSVKAPKTMHLWHQYRRQRNATHHFHSGVEKLRPLFYYLGVFAFYAAIVGLVVMGTFPWEILIGVAVLKWAWQIVAFAQMTKGFGEKGLCGWSPLFEIYFLIANTFLAIFPLRNKK